MKTKQERKNSVKNKIFHTQEWRIIMKTDVIKTAVKENKKNKMAVFCRKVKENIIIKSRYENYVKFIEEKER